MTIYYVVACIELILECTGAYYTVNVFWNVAYRSRGSQYKLRLDTVSKSLVTQAFSTVITGINKRSSVVFFFFFFP